MKKLLVCLIVALGAAAQTPSRLVETMEVTVVNIDVVVTDKAGRRVTGLTADDFEVFDRRRPQSITNFSEISAATPSVAIDPAVADDPPAAAAPRRRNTVIFFLDASSIDPRRRNAVFGELQRFARTSLVPGDRAMVAVWNRRLRVIQPFTDSGDEIERAILEAGREAGGVQIEVNRRIARAEIESELESSLRNPQIYPIGQAYEAARGHASSYSEQMFAHTRSLTVAVTSVLSTFTAPEDKKVLVYVGDYLPANAGADMYQHLEDVFRPHMPIEGMPRLEAISLTNWFQRVLRSANAAGVTAYMVSGGALHAMQTDASETAPPSRNADTILDLETHTSFAAAADATGGIAFTGGNVRAVLEQIASDFRSYYSIGFRPSGDVDGKKRGIEVRTKNRDHVVRYRESYVLRSREDEMADRVAANVYEAEGEGELTVRAESLPASLARRGRKRVPVKVYVQGSNITLIPQGATLAGDLLVFVTAGSSEEGAAEVIRHSQRISIPAADAARFRASHLTFNFEVLAEQGEENFLSAGVLDLVSGSWGLARSPLGIVSQKTD